MIFKLKVKFLKLINKLLNPINLSIDLSTKKSQLTKVLNKLKPYNLGYDLIRIGSDNDGGYLVPNILNEIEMCFSPGTGNNTEFERDTTIMTPYLPGSLYSAENFLFVGMYEHGGVKIYQIDSNKNPKPIK